MTAANILAESAFLEGKDVQAFPIFGVERRGAPVLAFVRIDSKEPIRIRAEITDPDVVVVLDPGLLTIVNVAAGLKKGGIVIINTKKSFDDIEKNLKIKCKLAKVDATSIARETLGVPITNTTMVGALLKATDIVKLESVVEPLHNRFGRLAERNVNAMKRAYQETELKE